MTIAFPSGRDVIRVSLIAREDHPSLFTLLVSRGTVPEHTFTRSEMARVLDTAGVILRVLADPPLMSPTEGRPA